MIVGFLDSAIAMRSLLEPFRSFQALLFHQPAIRRASSFLETYVDLNIIKIDSSIAETGAWVDSALEGLRLHVRGLRSRAYRDAFAKRAALVPKRDRNRDGSLLPSIEERVRGLTLADAIVLDWTGLSQGDEPVPYSREKATELLGDPDFELLTGVVLLAAGEIDARSLAAPSRGVADA